MLFIMMMLLAFGSGSHSDVKIRLFFVVVNLLILCPSRLLAKLNMDCIFG